MHNNRTSEVVRNSDYDVQRGDVRTIRGAIEAVGWRGTSCIVLSKRRRACRWHTKL